MESTSSYGVSERATSATDAQRHAERIRLVGYSVVPGGYTPAEVLDLAERLDALLERQAREAGGSHRLKELGEQETVRCCLGYDERFLAAATNPLVLDVCRCLLGDYLLLTQQNGVINPPGGAHTQRAYHRDLPYQHFASSRPLAVSALLCLDAFTVKNGGTVVLPASHRMEAFPSEQTAHDLAQPLEAPAGSFLMFDSMVFHRAGTNASSHPRRAVNHVYALPFIAQQISMPDVLGGRYADDPALARLLGYETRPAPSLEAWWARRRTRVR